MLDSLKTCKVKNIFVEIQVNENPVQVTISGETMNINVVLSTDNLSSVNITVNSKTGKKSVNQNNVDSVNEFAVLIDSVIDQLKAVATEFESFN